MANFPRWRGRKHFDAVATVEFTDGEAFETIEKVIVFLIVRHALLICPYPESGILVGAADAQGRGTCPLSTCTSVCSNHDRHGMHDESSSGPTSQLCSAIWRSVQGSSSLASFGYLHLIRAYRFWKKLYQKKSHSHSQSTTISCMLLTTFRDEALFVTQILVLVKVYIKARNKTTSSPTSRTS